MLLLIKGSHSASPMVPVSSGRYGRSRQTRQQLSAAWALRVFLHNVSIPDPHPSQWQGVTETSADSPFSGACQDSFTEVGSLGV